MGINKVQYGNTVLIDLTSDTVTADKLMQGYTAHDRTGALITGTATGGGGDGYVWQDGNGYVHLSDEEGTQPIYDTLNVNASGTFTPSQGHAYNSVVVPSGTAGTPTATKGTVSSHSVTVTPSVTNSTGWITGSTKTGTGVTVSASELVSGTYSVTSSGTKDVTNYASASVPAGTEGTPTATKGTVSNHSVTVTPSVTNTGGYITGSTKTGTAVTVSASELDSGTKSISANGTNIDVVGYASVDVAVPTGSATLITKSITQNGTYNASSDNADGYSSVTVNVSSGGGVAPKKQINFIDYDGTILYSYTKTEWNSVTALPSNPSHTGLTAQGWNWTKAQIDAQLTAVPDGDIWVGQMYVTASGDTEIDVVMQDGRLSPILTIAVNGTITVDWGDNTTANTVTGTSLTTRQAVSHTYASAGSYTIKIHVSSGSFSFYGSSTYQLLRKNTTLNANRVYSDNVQSVRLGSGITTIANYAFYYCTSLASITIPSTITSIGTYAFAYCSTLASITIPSNITDITGSMASYCYSLSRISLPSTITSINNTSLNYCYSLASITIPSGVTSIGSAFTNCGSLSSISLPNTVQTLGDSVFSNCYSLASITIPSDVTSIGVSAFSGCGSLANVTIPSDVTSIGNSAFSGCYPLATVTIPSKVTTLQNSAFSNCYGVAEYHVKPTTPPTLGTTVFNNIQSDCKIYVPTASLADYQTAWSTYASYLVGE